MSLFDRSSAGSDDPALPPDYDTVRVGGELVQSAESAADRNPEAIVVRPHKDNSGIEAMDEVLTALHGVETQRNGFIRRSTDNVSPAHAFEIQYAADDTATRRDERALSLQYVEGNEAGDSVLKRQLESEYHDSLIDTQPATFLPLRDSDYLAGAWLGLRKYTLYPINNTALDGFGSDPTGSIMQEMVGEVDGGETGADVAVQVMFQPARREWLQGVPNGGGVADDIEGTPSIKDLTYDLRQPTYEVHRPVPWQRETIEHAPSKKDKDVATMLEEQDGKAWRVFIRVFASSSNRDTARKRAANVASMFRNYYEFRAEQTFIAQPFGEGALPGAFDAAANRAWNDVGIVKTQREVAGLVNIPEEQDVATNKLRWSLTKPGDGVPPGTARFDAGEHGVESGSDEEQIAMLDESTSGDPFWFGRGTKHDIEAGVYPDLLDAHMFIAGRTRFGKTVLSNHFCSQFIERDEGGLIVDPKGDDADDFIREWPDHRDEEDLIVMDLGLSPEGTGYENIPRFNFMEIPPGYDPDSRFAATMIEALADDLTAMVAQSGGSQKYLGALMKRVTKTVARGLLKSGRGCSLLDLACACASTDGISEFSRWMDDERIAWIRETAQRFEEKEDTDLEPLAGRMDEWVHNDAIRDLISARDPSFSIHEAVEEGKVIVVRFAKGAGETERRLLTTALIRRTYASKRVCDNEDPFYLMCDEFDKVVTEESNLHTILSEAGGHNYRCVLACQAPGNQLPKKTKNAVANQINTFLTFNPGAENADYVAKHHTVDAETLRHMPLYKCYLKTHTQPDYDVTHSYLVDAFEPIRDVRERATGETGRSDAEVEALKLRSMERYGAPIESAAEQQASSAFYEIDGLDDEETDDGPTIELTDEREALVYKAVLNAGLRQASMDNNSDSLMETYMDSDHESTALAYESLREHIREACDSADASEGAVQDAKDRLVDGGHLSESTAEDGTVCYRVGGEAVAQMLRQGASPTAGKQRHRRLVRRLYPLLVGRAGLDINLGIGDENESLLQGGSKTMPDLLARPRRELPSNPLRHAQALADYEAEDPLGFVLTRGAPTAIEVEKATADSPAKTTANLESALENDRRCLFVVPDGDGDDPTDHYARKVWDSVTERGGNPPKEQWSIVILPSDESEEPRFYTPDRMPSLSAVEGGE